MTRATDVHLIFFAVLLLCAAAYPLPLGFRSTLVEERLGRLSNVLETSLFLAPAHVAGGDSNEPSSSVGLVSPVAQEVLLNALVNRAVIQSALPPSTSLQVVIPETSPRTYPYPQPTSAQLPSHTLSENTAEKTSSISATPHTPSVSLSAMATPTTTGDGDGADDSGDSGDSGDSSSDSDPSIPTPTSTSSSSSSKLGKILGSIFGVLILIGMIVVFIIWWKRS